jgi:hypothetical protein
MVWQEEEVQSLQGADLTGVYDQGSMYRMAVEDRLAHLDQPIRSDSMTPEGMRELHVRRLRGPWGRLYVKEMAKLRQLLPSLDIALPDFNGERRAIEQREPCDYITRNNSIAALCHVSSTRLAAVVLVTALCCGRVAGFHT